MPNEGDWQVAGVTINRPDAPPADGRIVAADARYKYAGGDMQLRYGIERIYAQQKEAAAIGDALRTGPLPADGTEPAEPRVQIVASLGSDGRLRLKGIIVDGKRTDFTWW